MAFNHKQNLLHTDLSIDTSMELIIQLMPILALLSQEYGYFDKSQVFAVLPETLELIVQSLGNVIRKQQTWNIYWDEAQIEQMKSLLRLYGLDMEFPPSEYNNEHSV